MDKSKHTPGPWKVGDRKPYVEVWGPMRMNHSPILASMESEPREANARLMAAAPDMLAALREVEWIFDGQEDITETGGANDAMKALMAVRPAIAKATGEQ